MTCGCQCGLCDCDEDLATEPFADWDRVGFSLGASGAADAFEELERALDGDALHQIRIVFSRGKRTRQPQQEISNAQA